MITPKEKRREKLIEHGVPVSFLDAIDDSSSLPDLAYIINYPDNFYHVVSHDISRFKILADFDVTPICEGPNGETFYVLLSDSQEAKFIQIELEQACDYTDFGNSFMTLLANVLIDSYEFADDISIDALTFNGKKLGFEAAAMLFKSLELADEKGLRATFELDQKWRKEFLAKLNASSV